MHLPRSFHQMTIRLAMRAWGLTTRRNKRLSLSVATAALVNPLQGRLKRMRWPTTLTAQPARTQACKRQLFLVGALPKETCPISNGACTHQLRETPPRRVRQHAPDTPTQTYHHLLPRRVCIMRVQNRLLMHRTFREMAPWCHGLTVMHFISLAAAEADAFVVGLRNRCIRLERLSQNRFPP